MSRPTLVRRCALNSNALKPMVLIVFKYARSNYPSTCPNNERIETNGDGVKPGSTSPMGHGGANVQLGRVRPRMNIFTPSPFVSELYVNSCNTRSEGATGSKMKTGVRPLTWEYCSPSNPGTPQNCLRRFCGEPHSGIPPPLGKSSVLYHGSIVTPFLRVSPEIVPP